MSEAVNLKCPLCGQPVSTSLYEQITGIWGERNRVLSELKTQRTELSAKISRQKNILRDQREKFKGKKAQLIQSAVGRETKRLKRSLDTLQKQKETIEHRTDKKIQRILASSHLKAEKQAQKLAKKLAREQVMGLRMELRSSLKDKIKAERQRVTERVTTKHENLQNTFRSTLQQMKTQNKEQNKELKQRKERIEELERQLIKKTTPQIEGLLYEENLLAELKKNFPEDKFDHTGKGGDVIEHVVSKDAIVGVIVFECKRVKIFSSAHVTQALAAKEKRKGDFAILVTNAMKKGTQGFFTEKGVIVVHATGIISLATILRNQIVKIAEMKLSQLERESAVRLTLDYLQGPEFSNSMESIIGETMSLYEDLKDEMKKHISIWKKRYNSYSKINLEAITVKHATKAMMTGQRDYKKLIPKSPFPELEDLPNMESANHAMSHSG